MVDIYHYFNIFYVNLWEYTLLVGLRWSDISSNMWKLKRSVEIRGVISFFLTTTVAQFINKRTTRAQVQYKALAADSLWGRGSSPLAAPSLWAADVTFQQLEDKSSCSPVYFPATPTTGSPQVLQQLCKAPVHLQEVDGGGEVGVREENQEGVVLQSCVP